jgi:hypothetical protein
MTQVFRISCRSGNHLFVSWLPSLAWHIQLKCQTDFSYLIFLAIYNLGAQIGASQDSQA